jgi:uncharacterized protein (TIGR02246 family)
LPLVGRGARSYRPSMTIDTDTRDLEAIRALVDESAAVQSDTEGFMRLLTDDVVIVNIAGRRVLGKERMREAMNAALQTRLANVITRNELLDIRFVRPDVAVVSIVKHVTDENEDAAGTVPTRGSLTMTVVNEDGAWRIALAQTTPIVEA